MDSGEALPRVNILTVLVREGGNKAVHYVLPWYLSQINKNARMMKYLCCWYKKSDWNEGEVAEPRWEQKCDNLVIFKTLRMNRTEPLGSYKFGDRGPCYGVLV